MPSKGLFLLRYAAILLVGIGLLSLAVAPACADFTPTRDFTDNSNVYEFATVHTYCRTSALNGVTGWRSPTLAILAGGWGIALTKSDFAETFVSIGS